MNTKTSVEKHVLQNLSSKLRELSKLNTVQPHLSATGIKGNQSQRHKITKWNQMIFSFFFVKKYSSIETPLASSSDMVGPLKKNAQLGLNCIFF